jgi:Lipase
MHEIEEVEKKINLATQFFRVNKTLTYWLKMSEMENLPRVAEFDKSLPTVMYFHGWMEKGTVDVSTTAIRGAYMDVGGYNVITADWGYYAKTMDYYWSVRPQMKIVSMLM